MMACGLINRTNHEGGSALPNAPTVAASGGPARRRLAPLQGWLATVLHRVAWALDPDPRP
jgi:hypothetical protein